MKIYYGVFEMKAHNVLGGGCNGSFEKRLESRGLEVERQFRLEGTVHTKAGMCKGTTMFLFLF